MRVKMNNLFSYQRNRHMDDEQRKRQEIEEKAQKYNEMVTTVLDELKQADYPYCTLMADPPNWALGFEADDDRDKPFFCREVRIYMQFNEADDPIGFICFRYGSFERKEPKWWLKLLGETPHNVTKSLFAGLSEKELRQTLDELCPPDDIIASRKKSIEEYQRKRRERMEQRRKYNEMVMTVLDELRRAEYPDCTIIDDPPIWGVGVEIEDDFHQPRFLYEVVVLLKFDENDNPTGFICRLARPSERIEPKWWQKLRGEKTRIIHKWHSAGLSEDELRQTLAELLSQDNLILK